MPDDTRPPHWTWLVAGAVVAATIAVCARLDRGRRLCRRIWWAVGDALIIAGARMAPPLPPELDTLEAREGRRARTLATWERERRRGGETGRSNGRCDREDLGPI